MIVSHTLCLSVRVRYLKWCLSLHHCLESCAFLSVKSALLTRFHGLKIIGEGML